LATIGLWHGHRPTRCAASGRPRRLPRESLEAYLPGKPARARPPTDCQQWPPGMVPWGGDVPQLRASSTTPAAEPAPRNALEHSKLEALIGLPTEAAGCRRRCCSPPRRKRWPCPVATATVAWNPQERLSDAAVASQNASSARVPHRPALSARPKWWMCCSVPARRGSAPWVSAAVECVAESGKGIDQGQWAQPCCAAPRPKACFEPCPMRMAACAGAPKEFGAARPAWRRTAAGRLPCRRPARSGRRCRTPAKRWGSESNRLPSRARSRSRAGSEARGRACRLFERALKDCATPARRGSRPCAANVGLPTTAPW